MCQMNMTMQTCIAISLRRSKHYILGIRDECSNSNPTVLVLDSFVALLVEKAQPYVQISIRSYSDVSARNLLNNRKMSSRIVNLGRYREHNTSRRRHFWSASMSKILSMINQCCACPYQ